MAVGRPGWTSSLTLTSKLMGVGCDVYLKSASRVTHAQTYHILRNYYRRFSCKVCTSYRLITLHHFVDFCVCVQSIKNAPSKFIDFPKNQRLLLMWRQRYSRSFSRHSLSCICLSVVATLPQRILSTVCGCDMNESRSLYNGKLDCGHCMEG